MLVPYGHKKLGLSPLEIDSSVDATLDLNEEAVDIDDNNENEIEDFYLYN